MKYGIGNWYIGNWYMYLIILAVCIEASTALNVSMFEKIGDLPKSVEGIVRCVNGSVYNIDTAYDVMAEFNITAKEWAPNRYFKSIERDAFYDGYFALGDRLFAISVPYNITVALGPSFFYWDKKAGEFQSLPVDVDPNAMPSSTSDIYYAIGVPDKAGSDAYLAMTIRESPTSDAVFSKLHVKFDDNGIPIRGELRGFHRAALPADRSVRYLVLRENVLYAFMITTTPIEHYDILDTKYGYYYNLTSNTTGDLSITSTGGDVLPSRGWAHLVGDNHVLIPGTANPKPDVSESEWPDTIQWAWWIFEFDSNQWTPINDGNSSRTLDDIDMDDSMLYVVSTAGGVKAASASVNDGALNISTFERIGDSPPVSVPAAGYTLYVNGSLYNIKDESMMEFDVATKQWAPKRNFESIQRVGFNRDYFELGNRLFAILIPRNITIALGPSFFFWDKDAGQFRSLSVDVDPNAMPSTNSEITHAIGRIGGNDAYLAMTSLGSPTSDAVFSKLHVEFDGGSRPISGDMRAIHRASLPINMTVEYLVLRGNVLYWFTRFYAPIKEHTVLDTDHVYYFDLTSNTTGNISTSSNNGTYFDPGSESYLIGDKGVFSFGVFNPPNTTSDEDRKSVMWLFDFDTDQWTPFRYVRNTTSTGIWGKSADMINRLVYLITSGGVSAAKIEV